MANERNADSVIARLKSDFTTLGLSMKDIETVSLSNGPGSYTGLRVGSAIAKGICIASNAKLITISTLDILAASVLKNGINEIVALIPSNSKTLEFYYGEYILLDKRPKLQSEYKIDVIENINTKSKKFVIDNIENVGLEYDIEIIYSDSTQKIDAQLELTNELINENLFTDVSKSEPFYLKDFMPLKSKKIIL